MNKQLILLVTLSAIPLVYARLLGNCYDSHGCATCAGYSWCEELEMCMRFWENPCQDVNESVADYMLGNNDI
jgi:hypothetical protein